MKHKKLIIILLILLVIVWGIYIWTSKKTQNNSSEFEMGEMPQGMERQFSEDGEQVSKNRDFTEMTSILTSTSEITSALTEEVEAHATYYLQETYVEENDFVQKGENILMYTNEEYLTAPYDCIITEISLPEEEGKILNSHYVKIQSTNVLSVTLSIDESIIDKINVGDEATIKVSAIDTECTGYVTNISSTAKNGNFTATIEFENIENKIKIGMTGEVTLKYNIMNSMPEIPNMEELPEEN